MLTILKMNPIGNKGEQPIVYFEFGFDNTTELPKLAFQIGEDISIVANNSIAVNNKTNVIYKFNGDSWIKTNDKYTSSNNSNSITTNGNYSIANNSIGGFNSVNVDVEPTGLIEKEITENGEYLPADDDATAYSKVVVDVPAVATYPFQVIRSFKIKSGNIEPNFTIVNPIDSDGNFVVYTYDGYYDTHPGQGYFEMGGYFILSSKAKKVTVFEGEPTGEITFTPSEDFDGFYTDSSAIDPTKVTLSGDEITPGDGKIYTLTINEMSETPYVIKKWGNDYAVVSYE